MGLLSNFIAGAAGAGGDILQRQREADVDLKKQQDYARFTDDLALKREQTLAALREEQTIRAEDRQVRARRDEEAYQASPERIGQVVTADRLTQEGRLNTRSGLVGKTAEVAAAEFDAGKGTRKAAEDEKLSFALTEFRQKSAAQIQADIDRLNNKDYQKGVAAEAAAKRDPASAALARVQLQAAQLVMKEKEAEAKMPPAVKELASAYREQLKSKSAAIDRAVAEGSITPDGLKSLETQRESLSRKV